MPPTTWEILLKSRLIPLQSHPPPHCGTTAWYDPSLLLCATVPSEQHQKVDPLLMQQSVFCVALLELKLSFALVVLCSFGLRVKPRSSTHHSPVRRRCDSFHHTIACVWTSRWVWVTVKCMRTHKRNIKVGAVFEMCYSIWAAYCLLCLSCIVLCF